MQTLKIFLLSLELGEKKVKTRVLVLIMYIFSIFVFHKNINELLWLISNKEDIYLKTGVRNKAIKFFL